MPSRRILRDVNEDARDLARRKMKTKAFLKSRDERKRVEMRFAHLKTDHGFERMRLRGLSGARDGFTSPPSYRTSRRWRSVYSAHQKVGCARRLRNGMAIQRGPPTNTQPETS